MRIDHIGYAVKNIDKAIESMKILGYNFESKMVDEDRNILIAFGEMDGYRVELVAPMRKGSPVESQLSKLGPTPYHLCYQSDSIEKDINTLANNGYRVIIPLAPAIAFDGKQVVFMYSLAVGLIEIVEE